MDQLPATFDLTVVSPDELILEGKCTKVIVPGILQELAVLPNHTPLYSDLIKGTVKAYLEDGSLKEVAIEGGVLRVRQNQVTIILGFDTSLELPHHPK